MEQLFIGIAQWGDRYYKAFLVDDRYKLFFRGFKVTLEISVIAVLLGVLIGFIVAIIKVNADNSRLLKLLGGICNVYTTVIRGTPVLLQLLIIYNAIFTARDTNAVLVGGLCFGINSGAYVTEIVRAGILAVDKGQEEAGRSLGFNSATTMRYIILPQAIKNILPALGNEFISLIKETSVGSFIAITDVTKVGNMIGSRTFDVVPPYVISALFYLFFVLILQFFQKKLERKLAKSN